MKTLQITVVVNSVFLSCAPLYGQYTKPVYVSLPSAGNMQHLALAAAKFKGFYDEMGVTHVQVVFLRGNSVNVQALVDRPSAPMLLVNGKKDEQVPIDDLYLLLEHGLLKEGRVFADAGHMDKSLDA